jgi:hypothetical protein
MSNPNKRKGDAAERAVVAWLRSHGFTNAERAYGAGRADDTGDIDGLPGVCIEVKNHNKIEVAGFIGELEREMANSRAETGVVIVKRRGDSDVDRWYAITTAAQWVQLMKDTER